MMKLFFVVLILSLGTEFILSDKSFDNLEWYRNISTKNVGCELTYNVQAVFQTKAMIFYSQILVNNSLEDVKKLVSDLTVFISECCMPEATSGCFQDKNSIFINRICEDHSSLFKNPKLSICCTLKDPTRTACFLEVQHGPPANMSESYRLVPYWSLCLQYIADQRTFVEKQLYGFSRHYRIFPPKMIAKIILESMRLYSICCKNSTLFNCAIEMKLQLQSKITDLINKGNALCQEYNNAGNVKTILWAIQYFTSLHPNGSMLKAVDFASSYERLSSECCNISTWTSNCFMDEMEALLLEFCSKPYSTAHLECCHETGQKRLACLIDSATQEAKDIPQNMYLSPEGLCEIQDAYEGSLILWYTYEYTRRHRKDNLDMVLNPFPEFHSMVKQCCLQKTNYSCFFTNLNKFGFSFSASSGTFNLP